MRKLRIALLGAGAAALVAAASASAFTPTNPYYPQQWYLAQDHAFDAWATPPTLQPVKVAVVDSGVDCALPDFVGRIAASKSFVGGDACNDTEGHGTIVAGEIAADLDSSGIVGLAYSSQLVVAKVVAPDGSIPIGAEEAGIRWAVNQGAQVVNLSLGGVRDPGDPNRDTYSSREASAVSYAVSKGAVVVAAAGNSDEAYATPWPYASWPAALPHVLGVGALSRSGDVPDFSDRDPTFVDLSAPGVDIFSTFPSALTALQQGCTPQGYTSCAGGGYADPEGTSFAAPQVSAAAAVLLGIDPALTNNQVSTILERTADDEDASTGCAECRVGRDRFSGWGRLDVAKAVAAVTSGKPLPPADRFEPNDTASQAHRIWGGKRSLHATLDYWDDSIDWYRVQITKGQQVDVRVRPKWAGGRIRLTLFGPRTRSIVGRRVHSRSLAHSTGRRPAQRILYRASKRGWYVLEVHVTRPGRGSYTLALTKKKPPPPKKHSPRHHK